MLHRLSLRVLPQLNALVTDQPIRKRKRLVMLVPGLVAFGIYRLLKPVLPLSEPLVLLGLSGAISMLAAIWAYGQGRQCSIKESLRQDGFERWAWVTGWIGFVYAVQLSLLVLAILKIFVGYDFLLHPEGPAMMALIISCTSVTRDAFEIGHVQRVMHQGTPIQTFPDGGVFRKWVPGELALIVKWGGLAAVLGILFSWLLFLLGPLELQSMIQAVGVPVVIASLGLLSFFSGEGLYAQSHKHRQPRKLLQILWFWVWPNLTFSATYFLVLLGLLAFVFRVEQVSQPGFATLAAGTALCITVYTLFLGWRKTYEEQFVTIPESLQRCPFVMGLLRNTHTTEPPSPLVDAKIQHGNLVK